MENELNQLEDFDHALARFVDTMQQAINAHFEREYKNSFAAGLVPTLVPSTGGMRYVRIVQRDKGSEYGSAWCFVEKSTGNILKCDGWNRPAKGVRGSIYSQDFGGYGCTTQGPKYNK